MTNDKQPQTANNDKQRQRTKKRQTTNNDKCQTMTNNKQKTTTTNNDKRQTMTNIGGHEMFHDDMIMNDNINDQQPVIPMITRLSP